MSQLRTTEHLEIIFWLFFIRLMKKARAKFYIPFVLLGGLIICIGSIVTVSAARLEMMNRRSESAFPFSPTISTTMGVFQPPGVNGQQNTLVILVDDVTAENPRLEGVWLVVHLPGSPRLVFLPIYPASLREYTRYDWQLMNLFQLDDNDAPEEGFLRTLLSRGFLWDHWIVVDRSFISQVVDILGGIELRGKRLSGEKALTELAAGKNLPQEALLAQAVLFDGLCLRLSETFNSPASNQNFESLLDHAQSDFDFENVSERWFRFQTSRTFYSCEFPILREGAQLPPP